MVDTIKISFPLVKYPQGHAKQVGENIKTQQTRRFNTDRNNAVELWLD